MCALPQNSEAQYSDDIIAQIEKSAAEADKKSGPEPEADKPAKSDYDELLPQAVDVILETKQASVSMLQRRLKLGYSRAARMVDQMEEMGIVGPFEGSKPRKMLITKQQSAVWQERCRRSPLYSVSTPWDGSVWSSSLAEW